MHTLLILSFLAACGGAAPTEAPEAAPEAPAEREGPVVLDIAGRIDGTAPSAATALFVSVKDPSRPGPPIAAKKLPTGPLPMDFTLGTADLLPMFRNRPVPAQLQLSVRFDADGDAMTREPGMPGQTLVVDADAHGLSLKPE